MRKKLFAIILAVLMIAAMSVAVLADNDGEIENATGEAVQKATVTVNLKLKNNLGIAGAIFEVEYDKDVLTPAETDFVKDGDIADLGVVANNKEDGKITLVVLSSEGQTVEGDGTVAKIIFKVSETAPVGQTTDITIKCKESAKANSETGSIDDTTIAEGMATLTFTDVKPGDLNEDNVVDNADVVYLMYHTIPMFTSRYPLNQECDYTKDGVTDNADVVYLMYHTIPMFTDRYPLT